LEYKTPTAQCQAHAANRTSHQNQSLQQELAMLNALPTVTKTKKQKIPSLL